MTFGASNCGYMRAPCFKSRTRQSSPLKIDSNTQMPTRFDLGVELLHRDLRGFSFTYQRFSLDITTVHYEDINENDRRVKFLWKALENFTNGKIVVEFCPSNVHLFVTAWLILFLCLFSQMIEADFFVS